MNPPAPRPKFLPEPCVGKNLSSAQLQSTGRSWVPMLSCPADFPLELFTTAVEQLVHHPEYNSTLILRAEIIADIDDPESLARVDVSHLDGLVMVRNIQRRLLPRRPGRDTGLDQHCTLYAEIEAQNVNAHPSVLVLTPIVPSGNALPYYHPAVSHLAFRFLPLEKRLRIEVVPLPGISLDLGARLYRTCLALLETLHRYGWGVRTQYRKRVLHDCLIAREEYQDLYLLMRERHKHMVDQWHEVTDPLKHVFEDIGIATFLILLWKHTEGESFLEPTHTASSENEPWKRWRRPSGGFVDLGCGNGLLTHILISEGYAGQGLDLRARTSWEHYPIATRENLHVTAFDPTKSRAGMSLVPRRSFIIGNHADELTPWMPVVATRADAAGYLSIPCCAWSFDAKFDRARDIPYPLHRETDGFIESLNLGADGSTTSSYAAYRIWLASLSVQCGWVVECETLRIPSTRNWAIVGRRRIAGIANEAEARIDQILQYVRQRGVFKTRRPEGRAGDH